MYLLMAWQAYAQTSAPKYSNEFLTIGVGARGIAMSGAMVAHAGDVSAAYWNPAGLLAIEDKYELALMHSAYFSGVANYDYAGFSLPFDSLTRLAFTVIRFGVDDIPDTRFLYDASGAIDYNNIRFFSAADYAFLASFARRLAMLGGVDVGINVKVVHRNVGQFASAWGFGFDLALKKDIGQWQLGIVGRDITGTFNAWSHNDALVRDVYLQTGNDIPQSSVEVTLPRLVPGVAREFALPGRFSLLTALDLEVTFDGRRNTLIKSGFASIDPRLGLEVGYDRLAFLRLGAGQIQQTKTFDGGTRYSFMPTFGLGVHISQLTIDYAMTDIGNQAEGLYSHVFSLVLRLNRLLPEAAAP